MKVLPEDTYEVKIGMERTANSVVMLRLSLIGFMGLLTACDTDFYSTKDFNSFVEPKYRYHRPLLNMGVLRVLYSGDVDSAIDLLDSRIDSSVMLSWSFLQENSDKEQKDDIIHILRKIREFKVKYPGPMSEVNPDDQTKSRKKISTIVTSILETIEGKE